MNTDFKLPEDLRQRYIDRRSKDVVDGLKKLAVTDWEFFERLGHQLKGNAPSYGYNDLQVIALQIERFAKSRSKDELALCLLEFQKWVADKKSASC